MKTFRDLVESKKGITVKKHGRGSWFVMKDGDKIGKIFQMEDDDRYEYEYTPNGDNSIGGGEISRDFDKLIAKIEKLK